MVRSGSGKVVRSGSGEVPHGDEKSRTRFGDTGGRDELAPDRVGLSPSRGEMSTSEVRGEMSTS